MVTKPIRSRRFGAICDILRTKAQKIRKNAAMCVSSIPKTYVFRNLPVAVGHRRS